MGASGKKLQGHGARNKRNSPPPQSKDGGYGLPPHPVEVRVGQRYVGRGRSRAPLQVMRIDADAGAATVKPLRGDGPRRSIAIERLLLTRADGQGRSYQFTGFATRRYATYAVVAGLRGDGQAELVLPEWHPARPVLHPTRLLPSGAASPGSWLRCTADLSQGRPASLSVGELDVIADPGPGRCHRPAYAPVREAAAPARPATGTGCGDVVLELPAGLVTGPLVGGLVELAVHDRVRGMRAGDRVYLATSGWVAGYLVLAERRMIPNGDRLRCQPVLHAIAEDIAVDGPLQQHRWRWRWWDRADETGERDGGGCVELAAQIDGSDHG